MDSPYRVHTPDLQGDLQNFPSRLHSHSSLTRILGRPSPESEADSHEMKDLPNPFEADMQRDLEKQAKEADKKPDQPAKNPNLVCKPLPNPPIESLIRIVVR